MNKNGVPDATDDPRRKKPTSRRRSIQRHLGFRAAAARGNVAKAIRILESLDKMDNAAGIARSKP